MTLEPISWRIPSYHHVNGGHLIIEAMLDMEYVTLGYIVTQRNPWPLPNCYLAYNDEDYFWFSETHGDKELSPYLFDTLQSAAKVALKTK